MKREDDLSACSHCKAAPDLLFCWSLRTVFREADLWGRPPFFPTDMRGLRLNQSGRFGRLMMPRYARHLHSSL